MKKPPGGGGGNYLILLSELFALYSLRLRCQIPGMQTALWMPVFVGLGAVLVVALLLALLGLGIVVRRRD
jgi:hypothetical protein